MEGQLLGKLAIVTGAGSGIGRAVCQVLAREGAKVIATDRTLSKVEHTLSLLGKPNESLAIEMDVSCKDSVSRAEKLCLEKFSSPPTIVVNSAGITRDGYLLKMSQADFDEVYNINLKGTFLVTQTFARAMIKHKLSGSVVNMSSIVAKLNNIGQANYAASKSGVASFTQVAAKEFGRFNIRVNAILPGYIATPMTDVVPDKIKAEVLTKCPLNRFGSPEEVAEVVAFLTSDRASYVNGALIDVTGGLAA